MSKSRPSNDTSWIESLLGNESENLLSHECKTISKDLISKPGKDYVDRVLSLTDRPNSVLKNFQNLINSGRLKGTGYLSILPVDQGVEHSAGASFAPNPIYFDPENLVKLAIEGGCSAITSTLGVLGLFDVATEVGLKKQEEDFGQTLAVHGVGPGPYLMLPFLGPSTLRDALGKVTSIYADPVTVALERNDKDQWIWIGLAIQGIDFREQNLEKIDNLNATSVDFYATLRSLYLERRSSMIRNQSVNETDPFQEFDVE